MITVSDRLKKRFVKQLRYFPNIYPSLHHLLTHILLGYGTCYEWVSGDLTYEPMPMGKHKPELSKEYAERVFETGYLDNFCRFSHWCKEYSPIFHIPEDVNPDWLEVIKGFLFVIHRIKINEYKMKTLAYYIQVWGENNPNTYTSYAREVAEFIELREHTNEIAKQRGWITMEKLHDPEHVKASNAAMGKAIQEILDKAEGIVPGARRELDKQSARDYIRRHGIDVFEQVISEMKEGK